MELPPEVLPRFKVDLPTSNQLIKKIAHRSAQQLGFQLILNAVKLTDMICHHSMSARAWKSSLVGARLLGFCKQTIAGFLPY